MTPERLQQIQDLYHAARDRSPGLRGGFLDEACGGDADLRLEVESLLAQKAGVLEKPAMEVAAQLVGNEPSSTTSFATPISAGDKLGPYEIRGVIGAGGMGQVYRAHDSRLRREVAIKTCGARFSDRFMREARAIAALNHPNICTLYDIGPDYLVMELVEGSPPTGPLPLPEVLRIAGQIASALAAAHQKGIVHRDLKPANVKITAGGQVKVLDFGLAKSAPGFSGDESGVITSLTQEGKVLGTPAYMAPEQAQGKDVDQRVDVWAFGVVLYELLTGGGPFRGESAQATLVSVLTTEPDLSKLPAPVRPLLRACLKKDPRDRLSSVADWHLLLVEEDAARPAAPVIRTRMPWLVTAAALVAAGVAVWAPWRNEPRSRIGEPLVRIDADLGTGVSLFTENGPALAISRDGTRVAFCSRSEDGSIRLYWRRLDQTKATALPGTESAFSPFFSPNGEQIAFFADGSLKKVELSTGSVTILANAVNPAGGTWGQNGVIVFNRAPTLDLWRVAANGGELKAVPRDAKRLGRDWPQLLPGGKSVLVTRVPGTGGDVDQESVDVVSLEDGHTQTLIEGGHFGRYLENGYLAYLRHGTLFVRLFDATRQKLSGPEIPALDGVEYSDLDGAGQFDAAANGTLLYRAARPGQLKTVQWLDRTGRLEPLLPLPGDYRAIALSRDGKRLALAISENSGSDLYIYDVERRDQPTRITVGAKILPFNGVIWMPDGRHLFFNSGDDTWWVPTQGLSQPHKLLEHFSVSAISRDGKRLFVTTYTPETRTDTWMVPLSVGPAGPQAGRPTPLLRGISSEVPHGDSPDGRWLSYSADETGIAQIYVTEVANPSRKWLVSSGSGSRAFWAPSGGEIIFTTFFAPTHIMALPYSFDAGSFQTGAPHPWSPMAVPDHAGFSARSVTIAPDGKRFAVLMPAEQPLGNRVTFVMNFFDEVRRRAATR